MKIYGFLFALVTLVLGCQGDFLDTAPTDRLNQKAALSTQENIYAALNGIHRKMVAQYLSNQACGGEPSMCIIRDCLGEDVVHPNTGNSYYLNVLRWADHRNEEAVINKYPFVFYYSIILQANLILEAAGNVVITDTLQMQGICGEALCFRAWAHFQLVQLYGGRYQQGKNNAQAGITYRKSSWTKPLPRNTVEDCYRFIHEDIEGAIRGLEKYEPVEVTHFSLKVAYGLKARVYLTQQRYEEAALYARKAIQQASGEGFRLMKGEECLNGFSRIISTTKEALWVSHTLDEQTIAFYSFYAYMSWNFNSTPIRTTPRCIHSGLYAAIAATDIRREWWDPTGEKEGPAATYKKYPYQHRKFEVVNTTISAGDFAYMRLSELYLTAAEALARSGQETEARQYLYDFVSTRDDRYILPVLSGEELCEEIMKHRRIELWGEGFRFTDLKRLNIALNRKASNHIPSVCQVMEVKAHEPAWQWLIPQEEISASLGLVVQNE